MSIVKPKIDLYLASTPFNILTSLAVASQRARPAMLLLIDQMPHLQHQHCQGLARLPGTPFQCSVLISTKSCGRAKQQQRDQAYAHLRQIMERYQIDAQLISNDRRIEAQYLMYHLQGQATTVSYIDDGWLSYVDWPRSPPGLNRLWSGWKRWTQGPWAVEVPWVGSSAQISQAYLLFPQWAKPELSHLSVQPIAMQPFRQHCIQLYAAEQGRLPDPVSAPVALVACPNSSLLSKTLQAALQHSLQRLQRQGYAIWLKRHPRDQTQPEGWPQGVTWIDAQLPLEYIVSMRRVQRLLSVQSTSLLTARWLGVEQVYTLPLPHSKGRPTHKAALAQPILHGLGVRGLYEEHPD